MRNRRCSAASLLLGCVLVAGGVPAPAMAGQCGYDYCWGALAIGPNGARGRSSGKRTAPEAYADAEKFCAPDCEAVEVFYNACAAMAVHNSGFWAFGWGDDRGIAEERARSGCDTDTTQCWVTNWVCSR